MDEWKIYCQNEKEKHEEQENENEGLFEISQKVSSEARIHKKKHSDNSARSLDSHSLT